MNTYQEALAHMMASPDNVARWKGDPYRIRNMRLQKQSRLAIDCQPAWRDLNPAFEATISDAWGLVPCQR